MSFNKKNLIIIGVAILLLIIAIVSTFGGSKKTTSTTTQTTNKDFDTKEEEPTPTITPTTIPTITPTRKPTLTPIPTATLIPTLTPIPTKAPTSTPRPTRKPKATPTTDYNIYATGVVLDTTELILETGESYQVDYRVEPDDTTDQTIYWSSNDGNVVLVTSDGWIVGENVGEATVTAMTSNGMTTLVKVKVVESKITPTETLPTATPTRPEYATRIDLSLIRLILNVGETKQLYVKYTPENPKNQNTTWSVSDTTVIKTTTNGLITAVKSGTATVTVKTENGLTDMATVVVTAQ